MAGPSCPAAFAGSRLDKLLGKPVGRICTLDIGTGALAQITHGPGNDRLPRFSDLPKEVELHLVQNQDGVGPFGAKGGGEASLNSMAANIANAVDSAVGVRIRQAPLTPERVWRALQEKKDKG